MLEVREEEPVLEPTTTGLVTDFFLLLMMLKERIKIVRSKHPLIVLTIYLPAERTKSAL